LDLEKDVTTEPECHTVVIVLFSIYPAQNVAFIEARCYWAYCWFSFNGPFTMVTPHVSHQLPQKGHVSLEKRL